MRSVAWHLCACLLVGGVPQLVAQGGSGTARLSARTEVTFYGTVQRAADGDVMWYRVLILWRGQAGWGTLGPSVAASDSTAARAFREYNASRRAALMEDATFFGGYAGGAAYYAQLDSTRTTLTVLGQRFHVPLRDSALVVLVDRTDHVGGVPTVVGTATVDGRVQADPPPKIWTSGDTTFIVRSPDRSEEKLVLILKRDRAVAAFWQ